MKIKTWNGVIGIVSRVAEIGYFLFSALCGGLAVFSLVKGSAAVDAVLFSNGGDASIGTNGFAIAIAGKSGEALPAALTLLLIVGVFTMFCMGMIFRNVRLIFKSADVGGETLFNADVIRMVREIGFFCIAVPVIGFVALAVGRLILGADLEASVQLHGFALGFVVLCLSQFFARGMELEREVEGLV